MLTEYIEAAMRHAVIEWDAEGEQHVGDIPPCEGVLAVGPTEEQCRLNLQEALEEWIVVRLRRNWAMATLDGHSLTPDLHTAVMS